MKLNLVPVTVSRGAKSKTAIFGGALLVVVGAVGCFFMITSSQAALKTSQDELAQAKPDAQRALAMSQEADAIIQLAAPYQRNISLANSMISHNRVYPDFYQDLFRYIPPFFRIYQVQATSAGADAARVVMSGTLTSYQQYADLMLALMRNKNVISITRQGFVSTDLMVPALQPGDQVGIARRPNQAPIPQDPLDRLAYFQAQSYTEGYTGQGNFGSGTPSTRFAIPGDSAITVEMIVKGNLQIPNPSATLSGGGGGGGATGGTTVSTAPPVAPPAPPSGGSGSSSSKNGAEEG